MANFVPSQGIVQVGHGISEPYQTNWTNVSPRIGSAWDVYRDREDDLAFRIRYDLCAALDSHLRI